MALDIIHKSGAWFSYGDQRIGQGRENTRKFLKENPETAAEIDKLVRAELMGKNAPIVQSASDDDEEKPGGPTAWTTCRTSTTKNKQPVRTRPLK